MNAVRPQNRAEGTFPRVRDSEASCGQPEQASDYEHRRPQAGGSCGGQATEDERDDAPPQQRPARSPIPDEYDLTARQIRNLRRHDYLLPERHNWPAPL
jgi:hypothetical protein